MHPKYIFYFHDNKVTFTKKEEIKHYSFSVDCLQYGKIIHIERFIKELKSFLKKEKIYTLISPNLLFIVPSNFYNVDREILLMSFNSVGINKIEFQYESNFYPEKANTILLNIHETYLIESKNINKQAKCLHYPFNLFKDKKQLIETIIQKNKENSYLLIGTNKEIPKFVDLFKNHQNCTIHYYNNYQTYIIEQALKIYKRGK